ncbi:hypothetical protein [Pseudomonas sp. SCB32]|uniref:hypothetical protein n=1 Tax=Pseudomonas sp. SCB32 TaxID=2653853 RepID=UPI001264B866|nr:hypothetical protein [Pseudomonas sp. SCB32]
MKSQETHVDVWSRVLLAIALLLLLIHQVQWVSPSYDDPRVLIPNASSVMQEVSRYPQPLPARDNVSRHLAARSHEPPASIARHGGWVF